MKSNINKNKKKNMHNKNLIYQNFYYLINDLYNDIK